MAKENLIYGLRGFGDFTNPNVWTPGQAPQPGQDQRLQVAADTLVITAQPWLDYDLAVTGNNAGAVFTNQTLDAASNVFQSAPNATYGVSGTDGLNSFADFFFGSSGRQATATVFVGAGSAFRNNGNIDIDGNIVVFGAFINNATVTIENGTASFTQAAAGSLLASFNIERGGALEIGGSTNAAVNFAAGATGRLLLDTPGAANGLRTVNGFDAGDTITVAGAATALSYQGTAAGGALLLGGANGQEVARIAFTGAYEANAFAFTTDGAKTVITTTKAPTQSPGSVTPPTQDPGTPTTPLDVVQTTLPVLDLDFHGLRDLTEATVNAPNDVTLRMTKFAARDTALSRADFLDGSLVFDGSAPGGRYVPDEDASAIARMYYTVLGRAPEFSGVYFWVEDVMEARNLSIRDLAPGFYTSAEFRARYGENTTDQQFVSLLYRNVLGREPEPGGVAFWTDALARGVGRADVVVGISESYEHQTIRHSVIEEGGIRFANDQAFL